MKRWIRGFGIAALVLVLLLGVGISVTVGWKPILGPTTRPLTDRRFEPTPARLDRGDYLVNHVNGCLFCHSEQNAAVEGFPVREGAAGAGRDWSAEGLPWLVVPNITPDKDTGAGSWSDDALARAIREGIGHDGRAMFPLMPYGNYRRMSDEDLAAVIVYIRSLEPVRKSHRASQIPFPLSRLINNAPMPVFDPVVAPDASNPVKRGEYLTYMAACNDCHTPMDARGQFVPGLAFAGGALFQHTARPSVAAANLTPSANGIPYYTEDLFLEAIRTGRVRDRTISDLMPWSYYAGMTDDDLKAIFAYLKSLPPIDHAVDNSLPPTACARCGQTHGAGARNKAAEQ